MAICTRNILQHFGDVPFNALHTGFFLLLLQIVRKSLCLFVTLQKEGGGGGGGDYSEIFTQAGYETRNNLEHFEDTFYPVDPGLIFSIFWIRA